MAQSIVAVSYARQAIMAVSRRFEEAISAGDGAEAARLLYTRDARVLPPGGAILSGREAAKQFWADAVPQLGISAIRRSTLEVRPQNGSAAVEIGTATLGLAGGEEQQVNYVVLWKQEDGAWKADMDIWN